MSSKALVVEDTPDWQEALATLLKEKGYQIYTANTYSSAVALIEKHDFAFATLDISLDVNNPNNVDGLKVLEELHKKSPYTHIVVVSGQASNHNKLLTKDVTVIQKGKSAIHDLKELLDVVQSKKPIVETSNPLQTSRKTKTVLPAGIKAKALIIEDDEDWQITLKEKLERVGFICVLVKDGLSAYTAVVSNEYDLITLDYEIINSSGDRSEYAKVILKEANEREIPIIIISSKVPKDKIVAFLGEFKGTMAMDKGEDKHLDKRHFDTRHFRHLIETIIKNIIVKRQAEVIDDKIVNDATLALLRNYRKEGYMLHKNRAIKDLGSALKIPPAAFLPSMRKVLETALQEIRQKGEKEARKTLKYDRRAYETGGFVKAMTEKLKTQKSLEWENRALLRSKYLRHAFILEVLYITTSEPSINLRLLLETALMKGGSSLDRDRRDAVHAIAQMLRKDWLEKM